MADHSDLFNRIETTLEKVLFSSRWLLAPFYLGLAASLIVLLIKFMAELLHIAAHAFTATESEVILGVLALVDLALTGSLLIIVIFSGYENFVSRIDHGDHRDWPEWMGKIDFSGLKLKLLSSIVAISAIQLLKQFMSIGKVSDRDLMWLVIVHVVFVVSSVLLALSDRLSGHGGGGAHGSHGGNGGNGGNGDARTHAPMATAGPADPAITQGASASTVADGGRVAQPRQVRVEVRRNDADSSAVKRDHKISAAPTAADADTPAAVGEAPPVPPKRRLH